MLKDAQRRKFDVIMAWAMDRLGRSLIDLLGTIQTLEACGVDLYLDQQSIDTTTPAGKLMFQVCGAFAEFERSTIRQRVHAGLKRAVAQGKQLGRPKVDPAIEKRIQAQLRLGKGMRKVARACGVGHGTVERIAGEMPARPPLRHKQNDYQKEQSNHLHRAPQAHFQPTVTKRIVFTACGAGGHIGLSPLSHNLHAQNTAAFDQLSELKRTWIDLA